MGERRVDLSATASLQQALDAAPPCGAIFGGLGAGAWLEPGSLESAALSDRGGAGPGGAHRPAWLVRVDGHAGWANSAALRAAGIDRDTPDPAGGRIERDAHGEPSGILIDAAMALVTQQLPAPDA